MRIQEKHRQIADSRRRIDFSNRETHRIVQFTPDFLDQFSKIRKTEFGIKWSEMKKTRDKKVRDIICDCDKKSDVPNMYEGIILSDKDL